MLTTLPTPMTTQTVADFETALDRLDVGWTRTTADEFAPALSTVLREPAVGAPLPFENVSLDDLPVTLHPTPAELESAATGVTAAGLGIAEYGSVVLQATSEGTEPVSLFPDRHVAVLRERDVVADMPAAFEWLAEAFREGRDSAIVATGPSATADMGALVRGAHGPKDVHVIVLIDQ